LPTIVLRREDLGLFPEGDILIHVLWQRLWVTVTMPVSFGGYVIRLFIFT